MLNLNMIIKNIEVGDYIEELDGNIDGCELVCDLGDNYGVYENENGMFMIENYGKEGEFIYNVI